MNRPYVTTLRFALLEFVRNRFAMTLLLVFVPLWDAMMGYMIPSGPVAFTLQSTGAVFQVDGHDATLLVTGFNAITLIVGFMVYASTRRNSAFDRRLVLAGMPQSAVLAAKLTAIVILSVLIGLYPMVVLMVFWPSASMGPVWLGYTLDALIYGAFGLFLGVLISNELAGFFLIIMVSLLDTYFQLPIDNPVANKPFLANFPSFGPVQLAVSGGFGHGIPLGALQAALEWFAALGALGFLVFWYRTRTVGRSTLSRPSRGTPT